MHRSYRPHLTSSVAISRAIYGNFLWHTIFGMTNHNGKFVNKTNKCIKSTPSWYSEMKQNGQTKLCFRKRLFMGCEMEQASHQILDHLLHCCHHQDEEQRHQRGPSSSRRNIRNLLKHTHTFMFASSRPSVTV